jgi:UDP-N-acetylglucosamine 3-dehydrogenase
MRMAIIGAGTMGRLHAQALRRIPSVTIAAFAAREMSPGAADLAREVGADVLLSADEALSRSDVDAVVVAVPTDLHHEIVIAAAQAGKHIICEKPLARTLGQAEAMLDAVRRAGVKLAVGQIVRYFPEYALAHDMVQRGELGTVGVARATRGAGHPQVPSNWYGEYARSGGVVLDMMIHDFDWLRWTFGPIERICARGLTFAGHSGKDAAMAIVRFTSGALAYAEGSWAYPSGFRTTLEVSGSAGLIRTSSRAGQPLRFEMAPVPGAEGVAVPSGGLVDDPYYLQMRSLVAWLQGGPAPRVTAEEAFEALRISLAALESIETGQPVTLTNMT